MDYSDIAVKNINNATRILNVDLETIFADWEEFKDILSFILKPSVSSFRIFISIGLFFSFYLTIAKNIKCKIYYSWTL